MKEFRRILVPFDFSPCSSVALDRALAIAEWSGAEVDALHVMPLWAPSRTEPESVHTQAGSLKDLVTGDLRDAASGRNASARVKVLVREGERVGTILSEARPEDLIVMGTHGRGGLERAWLGSVTEEVLRRSTAAVLTESLHEERHRFAMPFRRILCPHDFSPASQRALEYATTLGGEGAATVTVLHVVEWYPDAAPTVRVTAADYERYLAHGARERLEGLLPSNPPVGCELRAMVKEGKPHREILAAARELRSDIIVLGGQVPNAFDQALFGSNVSKVVRDAPCPVLRVRVG
jgi:nucleotide-binding universal stress UspA family protein